MAHVSHEVDLHPIWSQSDSMHVIYIIVINYKDQLADELTFCWYRRLYYLCFFTVYDS